MFAGIGEVLSYFTSRVHAVKTIPQQFLGMWVLDRNELKYIILSGNWNCLIWFLFCFWSFFWFLFLFCCIVLFWFYFILYTINTGLPETPTGSSEISCKPLFLTGWFLDIRGDQLHKGWGGVVLFRWDRYGSGCLLSIRKGPWFCGPEINLGSDDRAGGDVGGYSKLLHSLRSSPWQSWNWDRMNSHNYSWQRIRSGN